MTISSRSLPFTASLIAAAPHTPGVYALWQNGAVVYYGKAFAGAATIHSALDEHFSGQAWSELRATRCSWEVAEDPERRLSELITGVRGRAPVHAALERPAAAADLLGVLEHAADGF